MLWSIVLLLTAAQASSSVDAPLICPSLPVGTPLTIAVVDAVGSRKSRTGDMFHLRLAEPLVIDGKTVIPAGTSGMGEVIHAAHPKFLKNDAGELILAARYLEIGDQHLPLRSFRIIANGVRYVSIMPQLAERVENVEVPAGSSATAKVAGTCVIPAPPSLKPALSPK